THSLSLLLYLVPLPRDPPSFPPRRSSDLRIPWRNPPAPRWGSISLESLFRPDPRRSPADPLHGSEASDGFPSESPPVPNRRCDGRYPLLSYVMMPRFLSGIRPVDWLWCRP